MQQNSNPPVFRFFLIRKLFKINKKRYSGSPPTKRLSSYRLLRGPLRWRFDALCPGAPRAGPRISQIWFEKSVGSFPQFPRWGCPARRWTRRWQEEKTQKKGRIKKSIILLFITLNKRFKPSFIYGPVLWNSTVFPFGVFQVLDILSRIWRPFL